MTPTDRLVPLTGASNFRDLGGYPAAGGAVTRWGRLYRSDTLHELTDDDLAHLARIGLATVLDLRTAREAELTGRGPLGDRPVTYRRLPVVRDGDADGEAVGAPAPAGDDLAERYLWYLETGREALVEALSTVADPAAAPLVFHCAAGKDRTGVLAALVLELLGVAPATIVADYLLTADRLPQIMARFARLPGFDRNRASVPPSRYGVEAVTMERFLVGLEDRYGGAAGWARSAGLDAGVVDGLRHHLLDPAT